MSHYVFLLYGLAVSVAAACVWRFPERRMLALTMWLGWVGCVVVDFTLSMPWHPVLFPIADVLVGLAAFSTWWETRSRAPVVILVLALGCVLTNAAYAWAGGKADTYAYKA